MQIKYIHVLDAKEKQHILPPQAGGTLFIGTTRGSLVMETGTQQIVIAAGWVLVTQAIGTGRSITAMSEDTTGVLWQIDDTWTGQQERPQPMDEITASVLAEVAAKATEMEVTMAALTYLARRATWQQPQPSTMQPQTDLATAALAYMQRNLDTHLTLADLCGYFDCSKASLARAFRAANLPSPMRCFATMRIRHATENLQQSTASIANIAASLGFRDLPTFSHFFRSHTGHSPRAYRKHCLWIQ